jgi:hypothetical protein
MSSRNPSARRPTRRSRADRPAAGYLMVEVKVFTMIMSAKSEGEV